MVLCGDLFISRAIFFSAIDMTPLAADNDEICEMSDERLVEELTERGDVPGPINDNTRRVYRIRLAKLRHSPQQLKEKLGTSGGSYTVFLAL